MEARIRAYGKVNFTLDVLGSEGGYHLIDSLVCTIGLYDLVRARRREDGGVRLLMQGMPYELPPEKNNAWRAARAFCAAFGAGGADITIEKRLPVGGGLGGSSADAAGVLRALAALYGVRDLGALKQIADSLGSDTGYLLTGGAARITGRGERVTPVDGFPVRHLLLICPARGVSAASCYAMYDRRGENFPPQTERAVALLREGDGDGAMRCCANALTASAAALNRAVGFALGEARALSPVAGMSGSGSACYALFGTREACLAARKRYKGRFRTFCVSTLPQQYFARGTGAGE